MTPRELVHDRYRRFRELAAPIFRAVGEEARSSKMLVPINQSNAIILQKTEKNVVLTFSLLRLKIIEMLFIYRNNCPNYTMCQTLDKCLLL